MTQKSATPVFATSKRGYPPRHRMCEMTLQQTSEGGVEEGPRKIRKNGWTVTKHGEVSFPTQVRYDIVFFIGPIIIITALYFQLQTTCHIKKSVKKHCVVQFLTRYPSRQDRKVLRICTTVLQILTKCEKLRLIFASGEVCRTAVSAPTGTYG